MAPRWHVYQQIFDTLRHALVSLGETEADVVVDLIELE
jgi:hypothetical protein